MGCKSSYSEKSEPKTADTLDTLPESLGDKYKKLRENRFRYMEKRPPTLLNIRKVDQNRDAVGSPAIKIGRSRYSSPFYGVEVERSKENFLTA